MNEIIRLFSRSDLQSPKKPIRVIGIDLGTTNSILAEIIWKPDKSTHLLARCIEVEQTTLEGIYTHILVPSMVAIDGERVFVGEGARRLRSDPKRFVQNNNLFYECKNDIGVKRTYHRAPEGFKSAAEIGGKVLDFLLKAAYQDNSNEISKVVVTVPASFQVAQRQDTLKAAALAGLNLAGGELLDEPVAAFLDYLVTHNDTFRMELSEPKNLVVFDFGGGTCDVAVFRLAGPYNGAQIKISTLSVSRYHRLGGGDIDRAILYEVLIPQLLEQNSLDKFALSFEDKKKYVEPKLLAVAEALKISLCSEIERRKRFNKYSEEDKSAIYSKQPGVITIELKDKKLNLTAPKLTAGEFETILAPFLDTDLLYPLSTRN